MVTTDMWRKVALLRRQSAPQGTKIGFRGFQQRGYRDESRNKGAKCPYGQDGERNWRWDEMAKQLSRGWPA